MRAHHLNSVERERLGSFLESEQPAMVLAIQDTVTLDFSTNRVSEQLDCLQAAHQKGYYVHNHAFFTLQGNAIGLFDQSFWSRPAATLGVKREQRKKRPYEEKESYRWFEHFESLQQFMADFPTTRIVDICDQEADIQELFQARRYDHVHFLVRSRGDRKVADEDITIRQAIGNSPVQGTYTLDIRNEKGAVVRTAELSIHFMVVQVNARRRAHRNLEPTAITLVLATEINPPEPDQAVEWLLATSLEINSVQDALEVIRLYTLRWRIEMFHYVLKQGFSIEKLQLHEPQALQKAIVTYSMMALQVVRLRYWLNEQPQAPMQVTGFDPVAYHVAALYLNTKANAHYDPAKKQPTVEEFVRIIAHLGGSMLWKNKSPGLKTIWQGLALLDSLMFAYVAFQRE